MTKFFYLFLIIFFAYSQTDQEKKAIKETALNYVEGWYTGDAKRMKKSLHPDLAKRIVKINKETGKNFLENMGTERLVAATEKGFGVKTPEKDKIRKVEILDVFNNVASVKAEMSYWIDYMHIAKYNGEWKIVNVLWELKKKK